MKKLLWLLVPSLFFLMNACSFEDIEPDTPTFKEKRFKKMKSYSEDNLLWLDNEVNYNGDQLETLIVNAYSYFQSIYKLSYTNDVISSIELTIDYEDQSSTDRIINYDPITVENNKITLTSAANDEVIIIQFTSGYVDSIKILRPSNPDYSFEQKLLRTADENIASLSYFDSGQEGQTFTFSNFDSGKQFNPLNPIIETQWTELIQLFDLRVSKDNPTKSYLQQSSPTAVYSSAFYTYDDNGYITNALLTTLGEDLNYVYEYN